MQNFKQKKNIYGKMGVDWTHPKLDTKETTTKNLLVYIFSRLW